MHSLLSKQLAQFNLSEEEKNKLNGLLEAVSQSYALYDEKLAQLAVEDEENTHHLLRSIIDNAPTAFGLINSQKQYLEVNDAFCDMLGYSRKEILGKTPLDFSDEASTKKLSNRLENIAHSDKRVYEVIMLHKNGHKVHTRYHAGTLKDEKGNVEAAFAFIYDITKLIEAENYLKVAKEKAERTSLEKSAFLSSISHELRTPLNSIIGFSTLLLNSKREPISDRQRIQIDAIHRAGQHLLELINEVLDLSRIESGKMSFNIEDVDYLPIATECMEFLESLAEKNNITLDFNLNGAENITLKVDRVRFKQILINLLNNAIKYNRKGGYVWLHSHIHDSKTYQISIVDTGFGIPEDKQDGLFEPFNRLGAEQSNIEGTGIGLTLTKKIVEEMGGQIGFNSLPGFGSTFWIELPISENIVFEEQTEGQDLLIEAIQPQSTQISNVLYIDDNQSNLILMQSIIEDNEYLKLHCTLNPECALAMALEHRPKIIILDLHMPKMSGFQVLKQIKSCEETKDIPVIAFTADATEKTKQTVFDEGFDYYLTKPVNVKALKDIIQEKIKP